MKLSIYIPKDVEEELKKYGDQIKQGKGYSRIFITALRKEIAKMQQMEIRNQDESDLKKVIERLREQKEEAMDSSFQQGYSEGESRARYMDYEDLKSISDTVAYRVYEKTGKPSDSISETLNGAGFEVYRDRLKEEFGISDPDEYIHGLAKGITAFWKKIKRQL